MKLGQAVQISPAEDTNLKATSREAIRASNDLEEGAFIAGENKLFNMEVSEKRDWKLWSLGWPHLVDIKNTQQRSSDPACGQQTTSIMATKLQNTSPFDRESSIITEPSNSRPAWDPATNTPPTSSNTEAFTKQSQDLEAQGNENTQAEATIAPATIHQQRAKKYWDGWELASISWMSSHGHRRSNQNNLEPESKSQDLERAETSGTTAGNNSASNQAESDVGLNIREASWQFPRLSSVCGGIPVWISLKRLDATPTSHIVFDPRPSGC